MQSNVATQSPTPDRGEVEKVIILAQYADGPSLLDSALAGLTDTDLDLSPGADSWSIRQIVHHIADGDDVWKTCIKAALGNSDGEFTLQWYWDKPQMEWSINWHYAGRGIEPSLALLRANRRHIVDLLDSIPGALEKSIRFKPPQQAEVRITVAYMLKMQTRHIVDHVQDIRAIWQSHNV
jgi:hypothetical protein